jgi:hypothetical protein
MTVEQFVAAVQAYSVRFPCSVTSWGRTVAHNKAVGGVADSYHLQWLAVDIVYDDWHSSEDRINEGRTHGLRVISEPSHDHLQPLE